MTNTVHIRSWLHITQLEDRITPRAAIEVRNFADWDVTKANTLPWAINKANTDPGADEIVFVWQPGDAAVQLITSKSTLDILESVTISGPMVGDSSPLGARVVLTGLGAGGATGYRPFWFSHTIGGAPVSVIRGVDFEDLNSQNMNAGLETVSPNGQPTDLRGGGAIVVESGLVTTDNCKFENNRWHFPVVGSDKKDGGGAVLVGPGGVLTLEDDYARRDSLAVDGATFVGNQADLGGAIANYGMVNFARAHFTGNIATNGSPGLGGKGGAIFSQGWMHTLANPGDSVLSENKAAVGGSAVWLETPQTPPGTLSPPVEADFDKFVIRENVGQAVVLIGAKLTLDRSEVNDNTGVGVFLQVGYNGQKSTLKATGVQFNGNDAAGGKLAVTIADPGSLLFTSGCDFFNNNGVNVAMAVGVFDPAGKGWIDDVNRPSVRML